jgi:hypothetical protein
MDIIIPMDMVTRKKRVKENKSKFKIQKSKYN